MNPSLNVDIREGQPPLTRGGLEENLLTAKRAVADDIAVMVDNVQGGELGGYRAFRSVGLEFNLRFFRFSSGKRKTPCIQLHGVTSESHCVRRATKGHGIYSIVGAAGGIEPLSVPNGNPLKAMLPLHHHGLVAGLWDFHPCLQALAERTISRPWAVLFSLIRSPDVGNGRGNCTPSVGDRGVTATGLRWTRKIGQYPC